MLPVTARPPDFWLMTPSTMIEMPRVVITALTPIRVISRALTMPTTRPIAIAEPDRERDDGAGGEDGGDVDRGEPGDRADREVELVADQRHQGGDRDDRDHRVGADQGADVGGRGEGRAGLGPRR